MRYFTREPQVSLYCGIAVGYMMTNCVAAPFVYKLSAGRRHFGQCPGGGIVGLLMCMVFRPEYALTRL